MFQVIQSNDTQRLAQILTSYYAQLDEVFGQFVVITPAKVLEEWLKKTVAKQTGISALLATQFWGQYQWQLILEVLNAEKAWLITQGRDHESLSVPEVALLSQSVIQWRLFYHFMQENNQQTLADQIAQDENDPCHFMLASLLTDLSPKFKRTAQQTVDKQKLWRLCQELSSLYVKYLTQRPDWLTAWANGRAVDVGVLIDEKDRLNSEFYRQDPAPENAQDDPLTPAWLTDHYKKVEHGLRTLWWTLFRGVFLYRERLEHRFWQILTAYQNNQLPSVLTAQVANILPKPLYLFTVQQLPPIELKFLLKLSTYTNVVLLHYNPSMLFWADIVDKNWLQSQTIVNPKSVYFKDYGHGLLSRLGKASREAFAMLANYSGGEDFGKDRADWQPAFVSPLQAWLADTYQKYSQINANNDKLGDHTLPTKMPSVPPLLVQLKEDILMLEEGGVSQILESLADNHSQNWVDTLNQKLQISQKLSLQETDDSLLIHNCHSLKRQLEVARLWIGKWLNELGADGTPRQLSDIAIMLPDVESHYALIRSAFGEQVGLDGLLLPAKITGVSNRQVALMWQALLGFYALPAGRLYADELYEWLCLPAMCQSFGLSLDEMTRACDLLGQAGFVRGLDGIHLSQSLDETDKDYRHSFAFALDRLVISLLFGGNDTGAVGALYPFEWRGLSDDFFGEKTLPLVGVSLSDEPIIAMLCRVYDGLCQCRFEYDKVDAVDKWLDNIEKEMIDRYFFAIRHTEPVRAIFEAKNDFKRSLYANRLYNDDNPNAQKPPPLALPLSLVLDSLGEKVLAQQISAEPSSFISVGRFGSLRTLPFRLIIILNMNLSEFPRKDKHNRFDLMRAGVARWGDRQYEDDDNGAFLEAILSATENCWIFYDGQTQDGNSKMPATPVGELIAFIGNHLDGQLSASDKERWLERVLIKKHPPLPFHHSVFEALPERLPSVANCPPALLWQKVHWAMKKSTPKPPFFEWYDDAVPDQLKSLLLTLPAPATPTQLSLSSVVRVHKNFAQSFLKNKIAVAKNDKRHRQNELLALDNLENYQLSDRLLSAHLLAEQDGLLGVDKVQANDYFANLPQLPAGVSRFGVLADSKNEVVSLYQMAMNNAKQAFGEGAYLFANATKMAVAGDYVLTAELPIMPSDAKKAIWVQIRPSKGKPHHLLSAYLSHLAWQVADDEHIEKISVWQYASDHKGKAPATFAFLPILQAVAVAELVRFCQMVAVASATPVLLTPSLALAFLQGTPDNPPDFEKLATDHWQEDYEGNKSPYWATLLEACDQQKTLSMLSKTLTALAEPLYGGWAKALCVVQDGVVGAYSFSK